MVALCVWIQFIQSGGADFTGANKWLKFNLALNRLKFDLWNGRRDSKCYVRHSEATTAAVISLGFDSMEAVALILPEDLAKSKIPVGQIKMLIKAVTQTFLSEDAEDAEDASHSGHA